MALSQPPSAELAAPWYYEHGYWARAADGYVALATARPDAGEVQFRLGDVLLRTRRDLARAAAASRRAAALGYETLASHINAARALAQLQRKDDALDHLRRAVDGGFSDDTLLRTDPLLDAVRLDPRFRELLAAMHR